jgi:deoxyribodipyrimidine photo-lyase
MFKKYQTKFSYMRVKRKENSQSLSNKLFSQENGATPSDFINANMIELKQTGFMSRGKMWRVIL